MSLSVKEIQSSIFVHFRLNYAYFAPNTKAFGREADMLAITKNGVVTEFEIKRSRGDYFAEFKKKKMKHQLLASGELLPAFFYFVCEHGLINADEIPYHAGLIHIRYGRPITVKKAPRLHKNVASEAQIIKAQRSLMFKFFDGLNREILNEVNE